MAPIQQLPDEVVHKIAAGEVVERPVSVVKELVENAIDAGATKIEIEVEQGGIRLIRITDNGQGIPVQQLPLALKRHATSKIRQAEDLHQLNTLGFRGEALPSIASVSRFKIETATEASDPVGYVLEVREGKHQALRETPMPRGTRVTVEEIFSTTPARLKFLKRPETEWSHMADLLTALALGYPEIEWQVSHQGKNFISCPATEDFQQRLLDLFGKETKRKLYPLRREVSGLELTGYFGHPNFSRRTNRYLFTYVNHRYVQDRLINHAIVNGYRSLLMTGQYPMAILKLRLQPDLVDVNVHPSKKEVRFSNGNAIHHLISETLRRALEEAPWQESGEVPEMKSIQKKSLFSKESSRHSSREPDLLSALPKTENAGERVRHALEAFAQRNEAPGPELTPKQAQVGTLPFKDLRLIGQFHATYLLCERNGSLILIDQHAAHERIGFEKLKRSYDSGKMPTQRLLHPISFELSARDSERLRPYLDFLHAFGLEVEEFGEHSFVLKAYPSLLKKVDGVGLIRELLDQGISEAPLESLEKRVDHVLATMACHRQIRANHRLTQEEMESLLSQLEGTPRSYHCPHGRPVMVEIEGREIEKWFKRVL